MSKNKKQLFAEYASELPNFLTIFICAFFIFSLSAILLDVSRLLNIEAGTLNLIFTFNVIGNFIGNITSPLLNKKIKQINIQIICFSMLSGISIILFFSESIIFLYILYLAAGYFTGTAWVQANGFIQKSIVQNKERLTTIAYIFFPVGAISGPLISVWIVKNGLSWKYLYLLILLIIILTLLLYIFLTRKKNYLIVKKSADNIKLSELFKGKATGKVFIILLMAMIFFGAMEVSVSTWSPTFLRLARNFNLSSAGLAVSVYWISVGVGRILISSFAGKIRTDYLLMILSVISAVSLSIFIFINIPVLIFISLSLTGICTSGIQPLITAKGSRIVKNGIATAISLLSAAAALGGSLGPYLIKYISNYSITLSMAIALIFACIIIIVFAVNILTGKKQAL